jgi:hypothetical protein
VKIGIAATHEIDALWESVGPMFARATERFGDDLSPGELWQMCRSGNAFLLLVFNDDGVILACCFRFDRWSKGTVLRVLSLAGDEMALWQEQAVDFLMKTAKANGATRIIAEGRKGWERVYKNTRVLRCTYELEIPE